MRTAHSPTGGRLRSGGSYPPAPLRARWTTRARAHRRPHEHRCDDRGGHLGGPPRHDGAGEPRAVAIADRGLNARSPIIARLPRGTLIDAPQGALQCALVIARAPAPGLRGRVLRRGRLLRRGRQSACPRCLRAPGSWIIAKRHARLQERVADRRLLDPKRTADRALRFVPLIAPDCLGMIEGWTAGHLIASPAPRRGPPPPLDKGPARSAIGVGPHRPPAGDKDRRDHNERRRRHRPHQGIGDVHRSDPARASRLRRCAALTIALRSARSIRASWRRSFAAVALPGCSPAGIERRVAMIAARRSPRADTIAFCRDAITAAGLGRTMPR